MKRLLAAVLAAASLGLLAPAPSFAADSNDQLTWGVQPSSPNGPDGRNAFAYTVEPGQVINDWVAVSNQSKTAVEFRVYAADGTTDYKSASFTIIGSDKASTDLGSWTSVNKGPASCKDASDAACIAKLGVTVTVQPGTSLNLPVVITVPKDATPGDHSAGIVASPVLQQNAATGMQEQKDIRVGTRIYLRINGPLNPRLSISGASVRFHKGSNPFASGTAEIAFDLKDPGNTRASADVTASITGPFGIHLGSVQLTPVRNILPGGVARVSGTVSGVKALGVLFGHITVTPVRADNEAPGDPLPAAVSASAVAWAVPWPVLVLLVLVALAVVGMVLWRRRSSQRLAADLAVYVEKVKANERANVEETARPAETR
ncbi:MAG TPA: hypothetical protein VIH37_04305 [Candidatus Limnocylindrales bacterium]